MRVPDRGLTDQGRQRGVDRSTIAERDQLALNVQ